MPAKRTQSRGDMEICQGCGKEFPAGTAAVSGVVAEHGDTRVPYWFHTRECVAPPFIIINWEPK